MKVFDYISLIASGTAFGMASFLLVKLLTKDRKPWTPFFVLVLACLYGILGYITAGVVYNYVHRLAGANEGRSSQDAPNAYPTKNDALTES